MRVICWIAHELKADILVGVVTLKMAISPRLEDDPSAGPANLVQWPTLPTRRLSQISQNAEIERPGLTVT